MTAINTSVGYRAVSVEARQAVYDMALMQGILVKHLTATADDGVTAAWIEGGLLHQRIPRRPR